MISKSLTDNLFQINIDRKILEIMSLHLHFADKTRGSSFLELPHFTFLYFYLSNRYSLLPVGVCADLLAQQQFCWETRCSAIMSDSCNILHTYTYNVAIRIPFKSLKFTQRGVYAVFYLWFFTVKYVYCKLFNVPTGTIFLWFFYRWKTDQNTMGESKLPLWFRQGMLCYYIWILPH